MDSATKVPSRKQRVLANLGAIGNFVGVWLLLVGVISRGEEDLNWGGIHGPREGLARAENPRLFDQITIGFIVAGLVLTVGGMILADRNSP